MVIAGSSYEKNNNYNKTLGSSLKLESMLFSTIDGANFRLAGPVGARIARVPDITSLGFVAYINTTILFLLVDVWAFVLIWWFTRKPIVAKGGLSRRQETLVRAYIEEHLHQDVSLFELAALAGLTRFHFARAFTAAVGQSPHRHVSARRLERAKELLSDADRALVDIALALRFSCQANFTRAFRRATGQTPAQYRRSLLA